MRGRKGMKKWQTHTDIQTKKLGSSGLGSNRETPASQKFSVYYKQFNHWWWGVIACSWTSSQGWLIQTNKGPWLYTSIKRRQGLWYAAKQEAGVVSLSLCRRAAFRPQTCSEEEVTVDIFWTHCQHAHSDKRSLMGSGWETFAFSYRCESGILATVLMCQLRPSTQVLIHSGLPPHNLCCYFQSHSPPSCHLQQEKTTSLSLQVETITRETLLHVLGSSKMIFQLDLG